MIRFFIAFLFLLWANVAHAVLAIDGNASGIISGAATNSVVSGTLTTTNTNDTIVACVGTSEDAGSRTVSSVTATGLSFTLRKGQTMTSMFFNFSDLECWTATATATFSGAVTANLSGNSSTAGIITWGISGGNTGTPFDANGSLTCVTTNTTTTTAVPTCSTSTSNANDFIFTVILELDSGNTGGWGNQSGYTTVGGAFLSCANGGHACYMQASYDVVSSTQSSVAIGFTSTSTTNILFVDAIKQATSVTCLKTLSVTGAGC